MSADLTLRYQSCYLGSIAYIFLCLECIGYEMGNRSNGIVTAVIDAAHYNTFLTILVRWRNTQPPL